MRHDHGSAPPVPIDPNAKYEAQDVSISTLLPWMFGLFAFMAFSAVAAYGVYVVYVPRNAERTTQFPLATVRALPAEPRVQANPVEDIKTFRRDEDLAVHSYARDPTTGALHIPVDRALDLVAQEGLPTRAHPGTMEPDLPNEPSQANGEAPPEQSSANVSMGDVQAGSINGSANSSNQGSPPSERAPGTSNEPTIGRRLATPAPPNDANAPSTQSAPGGLSGSRPR